MEYPDKLIRGVQNQSLMFDDYTPTVSLFTWKDMNRTDNFMELSITWYDNNHALDKLLNQQKDGELQFKFGAVILCRDKLDNLCRRPTFREILAYERQPQPGNEYHGNILLRKDTASAQKKMIASGIALCADPDLVVKR